MNPLINKYGGDKMTTTVICNWVSNWNEDARASASTSISFYPKYFIADVDG